MRPIFKFLSVCLTAFSMLFGAATLSLASEGKVDIIRLVHQGQFEQARGELAQRNPRSYEKLFLDGLIAKRQNKLDQAATLFRKALAARPEFTPAKRELAHTLFLMGDHEGAQYHFQALMADTTGTENDRDSYTHFLQAIRSKRPYGFTGYFGLLPSTNANKGSGKEYYVTDFGRFKINEDSKAQSGIGLLLGGSAFYRHKLGDLSNLLLTGSFNSRLFRDHELNSHYGEFNVEYGRRIGRGNYYLGLTTNLSTEDWDSANQFGYGLTARGSYQLDRRQLLSFQLLGLRNVDRDSGSQTGYRYSASFDWRTQLTTSSRISIGGKVNRETTEKDHLDHTDFQARASYSRAWQGGLATDFFLSYEHRDYDGDFPGTNDPRKDNRYKASVSALHSAINVIGFTPKLTYTYTRNQSNISFYDYDAHDVGLVFTRKF